MKKISVIILYCLLLVSCSDSSNTKLKVDRIKAKALITNKYYEYYMAGKVDSIFGLFSEKLIQRNKGRDTTILRIRDIMSSRGPIASFQFIRGKIRTYDKPNPTKNRMILTYKVVYSSDTLVTKEDHYFFFNDTFVDKIDSIYADGWIDE